MFEFFRKVLKLYNYVYSVKFKVLIIDHLLHQNQARSGSGPSITILKFLGQDSSPKSLVGYFDSYASKLCQAQTMFVCCQLLYQAIYSISIGNRLDMRLW